MVEGHVDRLGTSLVIGLPVVYALSRAELTALVQHELGVLSALSDERASAQYRRWTDARELDVASGDERAARTVRELGSEAEPVERAADEACGDPVVAARALIRLERIAENFLAFGSHVEQALSTFGALRYRVSDLHDRWRRRLAAGAAIDEENIDHDEAAMTGGLHPGLAAAHDLVGQPLNRGPASDPVELGPLTVDDRAAEVLGVPIEQTGRQRPGRPRIDPPSRH